ncbi:hypothetical protein [Dyadobacter sp. LHD-138]|uniref:hypothetical protein n=1 Tax=Dyadobacter sp. LHD-138 TaxID=3071413 RepID=UPI0027DFCA97|nr:hypothetical protein [Dyadobacter sp. LHD-138]MDQ6482338.1 hypothetical protein [Dyadobacter sp. LHD-138]
MSKQKILIIEDRSVLNVINIDLYGYIRHLNTVKSKYEDLELGAFTAEIFDKVVKSDQAKIEITRDYWDAQKQQLKASGITNAVLVETVLAGSNGPIDAFAASLRQLYKSRMTYPESVEYIRFDDDRFGIQKDYEHLAIEKYCREWTKSDEEVEFIEALEGIHKAYETYLVAAGKVNATYHISRSFGTLDALFDSSDGKWQVSPLRAINYHREACRNMRRQQYRL